MIISWECICEITSCTPWILKCENLITEELSKTIWRIHMHKYSLFELYPFGMRANTIIK
jgi:hypothetical protein